MKIDLNCDMGESFGPYTMGRDQEVLPYVTSVNLACGFHGGDPMVMAKTVKLAKKAKVNIGAHPGYHDLQGFGRRKITMAPDEVTALILYQLGALDGFLRREGERITHVKPHGALYNQAAVDAKLAWAVARAVRDFDDRAILVGLFGSALIKEGKRAGLDVAREAFLDRHYQKDGTLVPRSQPGAVLEDPEQAAARAVKMVGEGKVVSYEGQDLPLSCDTICIHGDTPQAVQMAKRVFQTLLKNDIRVRPMRANG